jgi:hypothetical protein
MLSDPSWQRYGHNLYFKEVDGQKVGVVCATLNHPFSQYALNKAEFERPLKAVGAGKIDAAWVVAARSNDTGQYEYMGAVEAGHLWETVLKNRPARDGRYGGFWILERFDLVNDDDAPF